MSITSLNEIIFIDNLPTLDIHGYDRDSARVKINDFIKDHVKMKKNVIVIIHGVGQGILRTTTWDVCKKNKSVKEFKSFYHNHGCTVILLQK